PLGREFLALHGGRADAAAATCALPPAASLPELAARWQLQFELAWQAWEELRAQRAAAKDTPPTGVPTPSPERPRQQLIGPGGLLALSDDELLQTLPPDDAARLREQTAQRDAAKAAVPPPPPTAMCARDADVVDLPVHVRGNHLTLAKTPTPRGFLS